MISRVRRLAGPVTLSAGLLSLGVTGAIRVTGHFPDESDGWWTLAEVAVLMLLIALTARAAPPAWAIAACGVASIAATVWLLRFGPLEDPWILFAPITGIAVAAGVYLRMLDARRARAVAATRRTQRLDLARDLHDYVAHDVSEMLAQAQAGQVLAATAPERVAETFARIERAGLAALESMDRTVRMLHSDREPGTMPIPSLADLPELAERFQAAGNTTVRLDVDPGVPRDLSATIYRVVTEALTNVRRHAPTATRADIRVCNSGTLVTATITDDARDRTVTADRGGFGLAGLAARAEALGGTLTAGPADPHGWMVTVVLPVKAAA